MSNQNYYVPFGGIGEIEFNVQSKDRYKCNATHFNSDKTFPFFFYYTNRPYWCRHKILSKSEKIGTIQNLPAIAERYYENSDQIK